MAQGVRHGEGGSEVVTGAGDDKACRARSSAVFPAVGQCTGPGPHGLAHCGVPSDASVSTPPAYSVHLYC